MTLKNKTHDVEQFAIIQRTSTQPVRTENEHEQVAHPSDAFERIVTKSPAALKPADILTLQRTVGNRVVQRMLINQAHSLSSTPSTSAHTIQRQTEEEEPLQAKSETGARSENKTGLPDRLKAGIESLSGLSLDDVRVHRNSSRPAEVQALAYTQGSDIHLGPDEEEHLPHEAWHVVQQKQGRVRPTLQMKRVAINDEDGLEREAAVMGAWAKYRGNESFHSKGVDSAPGIIRDSGYNVNNSPVMQLVKRTPVYAGDGHATRVTFNLKKNDTLGAGSTPRADIHGWEGLRTLGLTRGDELHNWVRFHVLNAKSGGSGREEKNLTPTPFKANHIKEWNDFESKVKLYINHEVPVTVDEVDFKADITYYDDRKVYWRGEEDRDLETQSEHYPSNIDAKLTAKWDEWDQDKEFKANLDSEDGLIRPEDLRHVSEWRAYSDEEYDEEIEGTAGTARR